MSARARVFAGIAASGIIAVIAVSICIARCGIDEPEAAMESHDAKSSRAIIECSSFGGRRPKPNERVSEMPGEEPPHRRHERLDEALDPTIASEDFEALLLGIGDKHMETRAEAWRGIAALSNLEKIHWLGEFAKSDDETLRLASIKATRVCFGMEAFHRKTKATYKDMKDRHEGVGSSEAGGDGVVSIDMSGLPTKREAAQINKIVRGALKDDSPDVRHEAVLTASSFDVDTCHVLYQYAMNSCSDDVRLEILRDAEYGDEDYLVRLQMAALDVGGDEVVRVASDGIEKATGRRFANSAEAFEWYEENRTNDSPIELVIGEPEED